MNIYVFKTSIRTEDVRRINVILQTILPPITWSFDLEDCDNILRIKSNKNIVDLVCFHLQIEGFLCEELE